MLFSDQDSSSAFAVFPGPAESQREVDRETGETGKERQIDGGIMYMHEEDEKRKDQAGGKRKWGKEEKKRKQDLLD